jgi:hypothetical protein
MLAPATTVARYDCLRLDAAPLKEGLEIERVDAVARPSIRLERNIGSRQLPRSDEGADLIRITAKPVCGSRHGHQASFSFHRRCGKEANKKPRGWPGKAPTGRIALRSASFSGFCRAERSFALSPA